MLGAGLAVEEQEDRQAEQQETTQFEQQGEAQGEQQEDTQVKQQASVQDGDQLEQQKETPRVQAARGPCSCPPKKRKRKNHACCTVVFRRDAAQGKPSEEGTMQALVTRRSCRCPGGVPQWDTVSQADKRRCCRKCSVVVFHPCSRLSPPWVFQ